jgi:hypothetical protein
MLNGVDVTSLTSFGTSEVYDQVVPITINLPTALYKGAQTVVTIETFQGVSCGHTLRAMPSEFLINVPFFATYRMRTDEEAAQDMHNHCVTAATWVDDSALLGVGLGNMIYEGHSTSISPDFFLSVMGGSSPHIPGAWYDEVDKETVQKIFQAVSNVDYFYARDGSGYAPLIPNVMRPRSILGKSYMELADGSSHAYGIRGDWLSFPFWDKFRTGEYRSSRRQFWPYYRDAELAMLVDDNIMQTIGPNPNTPRVITPEEMGILLYGNLMLGSKGAQYWGYASEWCPTGTYYLTDPQLRIGLGGVPYPPTTQVWGFEVDTNVLDAIKTTWDAIGYVNADMQVVGPWIAKSDVSYLSRVISVAPTLAPNGYPAAETSALVSGLDTIVLIVLNLNMNHDRGAGGVFSYDSVDVTAGVKIPSWLQGQTLDVFSVDSSDTAGINTETYSTVDNEMRFTFNNLEDRKIIVITSDSQVRASMTSIMSDMKARLALMTADEGPPPR